MRWTRKYSFYAMDIIGFHISPYDRSSEMIGIDEYRIELNWKMIGIIRWMMHMTIGRIKNRGHLPKIIGIVILFQCWKFNTMMTMMRVCNVKSIVDITVKKKAKWVAFNKHVLLKYLYKMKKPIDLLGRLPILKKNMELIKIAKNFDPIFL